MRWLLFALAVSLAGCAPAPVPVRAPTEPIDWSKLVPRPSQRPTAMPRPVPTLPPLPSAALDVYCDDPAADAAWAAYWNAENSRFASSGIVEGETFAAQQARWAAEEAARPAWVAATLAAAERADASRPLPPGWGEPSESGSRLTLDLLCFSRDYGGSDCIMPVPGEPIPECMMGRP